MSIITIKSEVNICMHSNFWLRWDNLQITLSVSPPDLGINWKSSLSTWTLFPNSLPKLSKGRNYNFKGENHLHERPLLIYEFFCKTSMSEIASQRYRQLPSPLSCLADMSQLFSQGTVLECNSDKATKILFQASISYIAGKWCWEIL